MNGLIRFSLNNWHTVIVCIFTVLILGFTVIGPLATTPIPVDILPVFKSPGVQVLTFYSGMPATTVDQDLTNRMERWTGQAAGTYKQESRSIIGASIVRNYYREDIDPNGALSQVISLASGSIAYLPPGTLPPVVLPFDPTGATPIALVALDTTNQAASAADDKELEPALTDLGRYEVRNMVMNRPGVVAPVVYGGRMRVILAFLNREKLHALNLSAQDVIKAIGGADPENVFGDLGTDQRVDVIPLVGLAPADVTALVALHASAEPPADLAAELCRQTDGNPFFLGSLLAHLDEVAFVRDGSGTWLTPAELVATGVPANIRAIVSRRLAVLGGIARRALDIAAVCGLGFDEPVVTSVLAGTVDDSVAALDEAISAGLVREERAGRYSFAHALVRQRVLDGLSQTSLARLHTRVGEALERLEPSRLGEIAEHATTGSADPDAIVRTSLAAGEDAMSRTAYAEAAALLQRALGAADRLPADPALRYRLLTLLGRARNAVADEDADALWLEAARLAEGLGDPQLIFEALVGYDYIVRLEDQGEVVRLLDVVLNLVGPGDSPLRASAIGWRHVHSMRRLGRAPHIGTVNEAVEMARRTGDEAAIASTLQARLAVVGQGPDATAMLKDAEEIATLDVVADSHWMLTSRDVARALLRLGRRSEAEGFVEDNHAEAARTGHFMALNGALMLKSTIATASGDFDTGARLASDAAAGRPAGRADMVALAHAAQLVWSRYERGRLDAVIAALRRLDGDLRAFTPWQAMLANALAEAGDVEAATGRLDELMPAVDGGFEQMYGAPVALRYLPELCRRLGDAVRAQALLPDVEPWSGILLVVNTSIEGAADRSVAHLLATLGRYDEADAAYAAAAELERSARFPPLLARTQYWRARALLERREAGDGERAAKLLDEVVDITTRLEMMLLNQQAVTLRANPMLRP